MAWVTEYDLTWRSGEYEQGGTKHGLGNIYLRRDEGSYQQGLLLKRDSLEIRNILPSWNDQIVRSTCTFTIVNDLSDFYELLPLMTTSNGQIRIEVTYYQEYPLDTEYLFIGYLNCEAIDQDMLHNSDIRFTASGLINKLQYEHPASLETLENRSLINLLQDCLVMTGSEYSIRVDCSLYELNYALSTGQTLFNKTAVFTELFWKNNIERMSALDIIKEILKPFNCYIYWYQNYWYIEHYADMGGAATTPYQKTYVQYSYTTEYDFADVASTSVITFGEPNDIHDPDDRPQVGGSQKLSIIPGMRTIEIKLNQKLHFNLFNPDLSEEVPDNSSMPLPALREWLGHDSAGGPADSYYHKGEPFRNISNAIQRTSTDVLTNNLYGNGLSARFKLTLNMDTMLNIKWKFGYPHAGHIPGYGNIEDYDVTFNWWMYVNIGGTAYFIQWLDSAHIWSYTTGLPYAVLQTVVISGTEFDSVLLTADINISIPLGEIFETSSGAPDEDISVTFGCGTEYFDNGSDTGPGNSVYYGDFHASISETPDNNLISGEVNTDFLNKLSIDLDLFDSGWSYRNALVTDSNFHERATEWEYDSIKADSLARWLLASKFRLYNVARQIISLDYITSERLQPLQIWLDNKQGDKMFILFGDTYLPESDRHKVELREYDDATIIDLI